jgi:putative ABC transport system substrate-binding protein
MRTIGFLHTGSQESFREQVAIFQRGLAEAGVRDDDVTIEYRWAEDDYNELEKYAVDLVGKKVEAIVAAGGPISAVKAMKACEGAKTATPIVFTTVSDPVGNGFVDSLDTPGRNLTGTAGLTSELDARRLELLHEISKAKNIGVLKNPDRPNPDARDKELAAVAAKLNLDLVANDSKSWGAAGTVEEKIRDAFTQFSGKKIDALLVTADSLFNNRRKQVLKLVREGPNIPAIYQWREFAAAGGLMSYGPSISEAYYDAGVYIGRILDGVQPRELPVKLATNFELVINLTVVEALKLKLPAELLARAVVLRRR